MGITGHGHVPGWGARREPSPPGHRQRHRDPHVGGGQTRLEEESPGSRRTGRYTAAGPHAPTAGPAFASLPGSSLGTADGARHVVGPRMFAGGTNAPRALSRVLQV